MNLSEEEKQIVRDTWSTATKDINKAGIGLFMILFSQNPSYQNYFSFRDVADLETLKEDKRLKAHARNVMYYLKMVVDSLDDPEVVQEMVDRIGKSHIRRGLGVEQFTVLRGAVVELLIGALGTEVMNEEALTAWTKTYDLFLDAVARAQEAANGSQ